ncbi:60S acidic ribosomal protein P2, partial [Fragariocoptes setiger]
MRYVAAYMLAVIGGNKSPSVDDLKRILGSVGIEADATITNKVVSELNGKTVEDLITKGSARLATIPSGGAALAAAPTAATSQAPSKVEEKPAKKEEEEEEDDDMGFGLFD